jgi:hypothetical protein
MNGIIHFTVEKGLSVIEPVIDHAEESNDRE